MKRILILGGTAEARKLATQVAQIHDIDPVFSLAGVTEKPLDPGVPCRVGGFGGVPGLTRFIKDKAISIILDATHPYATQMSRNAAAAAQATGTPILHLERPEWEQGPSENWIRVPDMQSAVRAMPPGARAFTATGRGSLGFFADRADIYTCLRVIDPSPDPFPGNGEFVVARPPFSVEAEIEVFRHFDVTHLVVKNAGGQAARTKLTAAASLGLPIIIVDRIPLPAGSNTVEDIDAALDWIAQQC